MKLYLSESLKVSLINLDLQDFVHMGGILLELSTTHFVRSEENICTCYLSIHSRTHGPQSYFQRPWFIEFRYSFNVDA